MAMMKEKNSSSVSSLLMLPAPLSTMACLSSLPDNPFAFTMNDENCDTNNTTGNLIISADAANDISLNKNHIMDIKQINDSNSRPNHNRNISKPHRKHNHNDLTLLRSDTNLTQITTLKPPPRPPPPLVETSTVFASVSVIDTSESWGMKPVIMVHTKTGRIGLIVRPRTTEMKLQTQTTTKNRRKQQRAMIIEDIDHPTLVRDPRINIGDTLTAINDYTIDGTEHTADIAHMIVTMQRPLIIQVSVASPSTTAVVERRPLFQELQQQHVTTLDNVFQNENTDDNFHRRMKQRFGPQGQANQFLQQEVEQQQTIESIPSLSSSLPRPFLPSRSLLLSASDKDYLNLLESLRTHPIATLHSTHHTQHATANHDSSSVTPYFEKSTEVVATLTTTAALAIEQKREHHKNPNGSTHYDFGQAQPFIHPKSQPLGSIKDGYNYQCTINKQQDDANARKNNNNNNNKINIPVDTVLPETASEMDIIINLPSEPFILPSVEPVCMSKTEVNSNDVLCGRILLGTAYRNEEGNCRCRALVQRLNPMYAYHNNNNNNNNNTNAGRTLARSIVLIIRKRGGRFLETRTGTSAGYFYEIGDAKAEKLISNLLLYRDVPSATRFLETTDESSITPETNNNGQHTGPVRPSLFIMADAAASAVLPAAAATTTVGAATEDTQPEQPQHQGTRHLVPGEKDVICGRGGVSNHHPGNKNYRALIQKHKAVYNRCILKAAKQDVSISIVAKIREGGGRFLQPRKDETTTTWYEIGDHKAVEKTSQALREKKTNTLQKRTKYGETAAIDFGQGMYEYYNLIFNDIKSLIFVYCVSSFVSYITISISAKNHQHGMIK